MEKTIIIADQEVTFKSTGAVPMRYKAQFGEDYFAAIAQLQQLSKLNNKKLDIDTISQIDFDVFYRIAWTLAKTADNKISDPLTWLDSFESFPLIEIINELSELIVSSIQGKKK